MRSKIISLVGPQEALLASVKTGKLAGFGHVTHHDSLSVTILQGTKEDERRRDRRGNAGWTTSKMAELITRVSCRKDWNRISAKSSLMVCELNGILKF